MISAMGGVPASVRVVNLAGEPLKDNLVQHIYQQTGVERVYNLYGPSEDTTYSTFTAMVRGVSKEPSIGRAIANTQMYVLDSQMRPVPQGVVGEIYLGGDGLARGYLNRPELTAEKWVPTPSFAPHIGAVPNGGGWGGTRLYRTGDLGRWRADGEVDFLGRADHQVKVRGFRIELGEIEAALSRHPAVKENIVIVREDSPNDKHLIAYIVRNAESTITSDELRHFLAQSLPAYMAPAIFVFLEALPLTPNGKIDRRALPAPEGVRPEDKTFAAPRTALEEALAAIWAGVLKLDRVGIHDNFFDLGGHSLLATQIVSRIRQNFQIELPLRQLFENPTIAGLAKNVEAARSLLPTPSWLPTLPGTRKADVPLSFAQQRLWFLDQLEPGSAFYNIAVAVPLLGPLDIPALTRSLNEIIRRHETLRTTFTTVDDQAVQVIAPELTVTLPVIDLHTAPERQAQVQLLATEEARLPFDLAHGPLVRASLLRLEESEHVLLLTLHIHLNSSHDRSMHRR